MNSHSKRVGSLKGSPQISMLEMIKSFLIEQGLNANEVQGFLLPGSIESSWFDQLSKRGPNSLIKVGCSILFSCCLVCWGKIGIKFKLKAVESTKRNLEPPSMGYLIIDDKEATLLSFLHMFGDSGKIVVIIEGLEVM